MTARKIIKVVAIRCQICSKINFGWGSAPDPLGELKALPQTPSWNKGDLLLHVYWKCRVQEGEGRAERGRPGGRGEHGKEIERREGRGGQWKAEGRDPRPGLGK